MLNTTKKVKDALQKTPASVCNLLVGGQIGGLDYNTMASFWIISGNAIHRIDRVIISCRRGTYLSLNFCIWLPHAQWELSLPWLDSCALNIPSELIPVTTAVPRELSV